MDAVPSPRHAGIPVLGATRGRPARSRCAAVVTPGHRASVTRALTRGRRRSCSPAWRSSIADRRLTWPGPSGRLGLALLVVGGAAMRLRPDRRPSTDRRLRPHLADVALLACCVPFAIAAREEFVGALRRRAYRREVIADVVAAHAVARRDRLHRDRPAVPRPSQSSLRGDLRDPRRHDRRDLRRARAVGARRDRTCSRSPGSGCSRRRPIGSAPRGRPARATASATWISVTYVVAPPAARLRVPARPARPRVASRVREADHDRAPGADEHHRDRGDARRCRSSRSSTTRAGSPARSRR